jgi:hypothetical protein
VGFGRSSDDVQSSEKSREIGRNRLTLKAGEIQRGNNNETSAKKKYENLGTERTQ